MEHLVRIQSNLTQRLTSS
ncbi:UNVERIFIED_CONTAM: hypothetical protein GTU68_021618 [Idotea baltica]|nr:hypothetical protein [Idotea baltica]